MKALMFLLQVFKGIFSREKQPSPPNENPYEDGGGYEAAFPVEPPPQAQITADQPRWQQPDLTVGTEVFVPLDPTKPMSAGLGQQGFQLNNIVVVEAGPFGKPVTIGRIVSRGSRRVRIEFELPSGRKMTFRRSAQNLATSITIRGGWPLQPVLVNPN